MVMTSDIRAPDTPGCNAVTEFVRQHSAPFLFNHVARSFAFAEHIGRARRLHYDRELLYFATMMHDLGLTALAPVRERFEIEGADAAKAFLSERGVPDVDVEIVWDAIALHTTAQIPLRKSPEVALCHLGIASDLRIVAPDAISDQVLDTVLHAYPHLDLHHALLTTLVDLYRRNPAAAASHAVADACERKVPGFRRFNLCDVLIAGAPSRSDADTAPGSPRAPG